jgi:hypothetical protein
VQPRNFSTLSEEPNVSEKNFFSEFSILNTGTEIPLTFTAWSSISCVSAALGRRVWIDMGPFAIYPNMFVVLIAGSGRMRKSTSIGVARKMLEKITPPINFISQKITPEALLDALKQTPGGAAGKVIIGAGIEPVGQGFLITDELTNFLNGATNENNINPILTDIYDCADPYSYHTKSRGKEKLRSTQLGMLAATTPEELRKAIPETAIGSGLASRILFIYEDSPMRPVTFPVYSGEQITARDFCIKALQRLSLLSGQLEIPNDCREWCHDCYHNRCSTSPLLDDPHLRGYASRRLIHLLKLGLVLSTGRSERVSISVPALDQAESLLSHNESQLPKIVNLVTMNDKGAIIHYVLGLINKAQRITRQDLMASVAHRIDTAELTAVIDTLAKGNMIEVIVNGPSIVYTVRRK